MAIDFMTMPLSRYLSGDFVTPAMAFAWQQGLPYSLFGPDGRRDIPKDMPFGGADAPASRARFVPMILDDLKKLPGTVGASLWDEASVADPTFHRVDPKSYESLLEEAKTRAARPSFLGLVEAEGRRPDAHRRVRVLADYVRRAFRHARRVRACRGVSARRLARARRRWLVRLDIERARYVARCAPRRGPLAIANDC
jgi:hypothetical protein